MSFEKAMSYVTLAVWHEAAQGENGYYSLVLNCGHTMSCSASALRNNMLCVECAREAIKPESDEHHGSV